MQAEQKQKIKTKLAAYCERLGSQNKAANSLKGVSGATVSNILNDQWDQIKPEMWLNVGKQVGYTTKEWVFVETRNFTFLTKLLKDASLHSHVFAAIDRAGSGKSATAKMYVENNKRVYRLECREYWNRKQFLYEVLTALGREASGMNVNELMASIVKTIKTSETPPTLIFDEFDKVSDQVLCFFITLYNELEDECAIMVCCTSHLEKRVERGLRLNKKGYQEFYSRIGRKFIELPGVCTSDIQQICRANGVTDDGLIKKVVEDCEYDLRRVKRKIHAIKNAA